MIQKTDATQGFLATVSVFLNLLEFSNVEHGAKTWNGATFLIFIEVCGKVVKITILILVLLKY